MNILPSMRLILILIKKILNNLYEIELGLAHRFNNKLLPENTFFINIQKDL